MVICGHNAISMPWGNTAYLSGEDLSRSLSKIESVGLRKCPPNKHFGKLAPHHGAKKASIDSV